MAEGRPPHALCVLTEIAPRPFPNVARHIGHSLRGVAFREHAHGRRLTNHHVEVRPVLVGIGPAPRENAALGAAGVFELARGRPVLRASRRALVLIAIVFAAGMLGGWAWKVAAGVMNGSLPLR